MPPTAIIQNEHNYTYGKAPVGINNLFEHAVHQKSLLLTRLIQMISCNLKRTSQKDCDMKVFQVPSLSFLISHKSNCSKQTCVMHRIYSDGVPPNHVFQQDCLCFIFHHLAKFAFAQFCFTQASVVSWGHLGLLGPRWIGNPGPSAPEMHSDHLCTENLARKRHSYKAESDDNDSIGRMKNHELLQLLHDVTMLHASFLLLVVARTYSRLLRLFGDHLVKFESRVTQRIARE